MNKIKEFCRYYDKHEKIKTAVKDERAWRQPYVNFQVRVKDENDNSFFATGDHVLNLDQEDIDYLHAKYSKMLDAEKEAKLEAIEKEYKH